MELYSQQSYFPCVNSLCVGSCQNYSKLQSVGVSSEVYSLYDKLSGT